MPSGKECPVLPSVECLSQGEWGTGVIYKENNKLKEKPPRSFSCNKAKHERMTREPTSIIKIEQFKWGSVSTESESHELAALGEKSKKRTELPYMLSSLLATVLEDTANQLKILVEGSNEIKIIRVKSDWESWLHKKFEVKQPQSKDVLEGIDRKKLHCDDYKINKLEADRIYVIDIIKHTYVNLCLDKTFGALEDSVHDLITKDCYRIELAEEEAKNRMLLRDITRQLRQLRNHVKSVQYDSNVKIDQLTSQVEDAVLFAEARSRFITNLQRSRTEQHTLNIQETETVYAESGEYYKEKAEEEHRAHMEVLMLMNIAINETLEKVEKMMSKYDKSMEDIDLKIQIKKNDYDVQKQKRTELEDTINKHMKLMSDWMNFKDQREKARQYREMMHNAAIVVQAWWRGLLVRKELGPFKPTKRRPPPTPKPKKK